MAGREYVAPSVPMANRMIGEDSRRFNSNGFGLANGAEAIQSNPNFLSSSTFSNTTPTEFGLQPNKSVPYHYSCKSLDESRFSPGALMFSIKNPRRFGLSCPEGSRRVEVLIELNAWLDNISDPKHEAHAAGVKFLKTAADVIREINSALESKYDESLSNFAFNFKFRPYTVVDSGALDSLVQCLEEFDPGVKVGRCRLTVSKPELKARLVSALETNM
jgi:hypothetical protein